MGGQTLLATMQMAEGRGALAVVLLEHAHESEGVIPEARGELLVESPGDADETGIVLEGDVRRGESEPVGAGCGLLVRRRQRDGIPCVHGYGF